MSDDAASKTKNEAKQRGRPPKYPKRQELPKDGVVDEPTDDAYVMEFLHDRPLILKKLCQFLKQSSIYTINMVFMRDCIVLWCLDHHRCQIRIKIDCREVVRYYCAEEFDIWISCENLGLVMGTADKSYQTVLMSLTHDDRDKSIRVVLKNDVEVEEAHEIELIADSTVTKQEERFADRDYMIKFVLNRPYFKKMIADVKTICDRVALNQDGVNDPLTLEYYKKTDKKIKSLNTFTNSERIKLESRLQEGNTFRVCFTLDDIKPISSVTMFENIAIYADEKKHVMFLIHTDDPAIEMQILKDIIDDSDGPVRTI